MNKFIKVTAGAEVLSLNVNHIVAIEGNNDGCTIYLSCPVKSHAFRNARKAEKMS